MRSCTYKHNGYAQAPYPAKSPAVHVARVLEAQGKENNDSNLVPPGFRYPLSVSPPPSCVLTSSMSRSRSSLMDDVNGLSSSRLACLA